MRAIARVICDGIATGLVQLSHNCCNLLWCETLPCIAGQFSRYLQQCCTNFNSKFLDLNMKKTLTIVIPVIGLLFAATVSASGGGGFSSGASSKRVDQQYELGKSYYKARLADGSKLEYCVKSDSDLKKLSRRSVKQFKKGSAADFVAALHNCADPNQKIADLVTDEQGQAILHYLNKRFKLRLKG